MPKGKPQDAPKICPACGKEVRKDISKPYNFKRNRCAACAKKQIRRQAVEAHQNEYARAFDELFDTSYMLPESPTTHAGSPGSPGSSFQADSPGDPLSWLTVDNVGQLPTLVLPATVYGSESGSSAGASGSGGSSAAGMLGPELFAGSAMDTAQDGGDAEYASLKQALGLYGLGVVDEQRLALAAQPLTAFQLLQRVLQCVQNPTQIEAFVGLLNVRGKSSVEVDTAVNRLRCEFMEGTTTETHETVRTHVRIRSDSGGKDDQDDGDEDDYDDLHDSIDEEEAKEYEQLRAKQQEDRLKVVDGMVKRLTNWLENPDKINPTRVFVSESVSPKDGTRIESFQVESCEPRGALLHATLTCTGNHAGAANFKAQLSISSAHKTFRIHDVKFENLEPEKPLQGKFVGETLEDGTKVKANSDVVKTWTVRNTDTRPWEGVEVFNCETDEVVAKLDTVQPQSEVVVQVTVHIPADVPNPNEYEGAYRLRKNGQNMAVVLGYSFVVESQ